MHFLPPQFITPEVCNLDVDNHLRYETMPCAGMSFQEQDANLVNCLCDMVERVKGLTLYKMEEFFCLLS